MPMLYNTKTLNPFTENGPSKFTNVYLEPLTISRFPFPTRVLTHPPTWTETNSRQTYHEFAFITFWDLALRGRVGLRSEVTRAAN